MNRVIAVCGLDCAACGGYQATQANDEAAKERVAAKWRQEYNIPNLTAAGVTCDGCTTVSGQTCFHCPHCATRTCGLEHKVANCAHCADYEGCAKLAGFFAAVPTAKARLDEIRRTL
jgi:hypothetical protein